MSREGRLAIGIGLGLIGLVLLVRRRQRSSASPTTSVNTPVDKAMAKRKGQRHGDASPYLSKIRVAVNRHPELNGRLHVYLGLLDQESRFDPAARSPTGAAGIAQFTNIGRAEVRRLMAISKYGSRFAGSTAIGDRLRSFDRDGAFDATTAIEAGALYLASLLGTYGGHVEAALTAYNAGGRPARIVQQAGTHAAALPVLLLLPDNQRSQSPEYAPGVLERAAFFRGQGLA